MGPFWVRFGSGISFGSDLGQVWVKIGLDFGRKYLPLSDSSEDISPNKLFLVSLGPSSSSSLELDPLPDLSEPAFGGRLFIS